MPIPTVPAKISKFPELALLCLREDRRHYSACAKIGCTSESKINSYLFCASLGLHYFACAKIGGASEMKTKNFVFCFAFHSACTIFADGTTKTKKQCFRFAARTTM